MKMADYKLHIIEGHEKFIPRGDLVVDVRYFDYDSLIRMYGKQLVDKYLSDLRK